MGKIGISVKLDVKKLDKARFFAAQSGALYVDLTMFLDPNNEGQYGDHGFITQSTTKEEREQNVQTPILGNGKIFYGLQEMKGQAPQQGFQQQPQHMPSQQLAQKRQQTQQGFQQQPQQGGFSQQGQQQAQAPKVNPQDPTIDFDDDIPF